MSDHAPGVVAVACEDLREFSDGIPMADERYHVLARKWRPATFSEVIGQEHVSRSLANAIRHGRIHHAYLFCGPRGVGKTTIARILAKALNCVDGPTAEPCLVCSSCRAVTDGSSMDVMEIDGASNNSVEQIRDLRETLGYSPAESRYRVIIIDEVHMLSKAAFNALLKSLEEPPKHVVFIFATTEANKVIPTVQSRCQRYDFHRLTVPQIRLQLQKICEAEGVDIEPGGIDLIAQRADGAMRDGESLLDQVIAAHTGHISAEDVADLIGAVARDVYIGLLDAISERNTAETLGVVSRAINRGRSLSEFLTGLMLHLRHLLACSINATEAIADVDESERDALTKQAKRFSERDLIRMLNIVAETESSLNTSAAPQVRVELALLKLAYLERSTDLAELMARLDGLSGDDSQPKRPVPTSARGTVPPDAGSARGYETKPRARETHRSSGTNDANVEPDEESEPAPPWYDDDDSGGQPPDPSETTSTRVADRATATKPLRPSRPPESGANRPRTAASIAVITARWPEIADVLKGRHGVPAWIDTQVRPVQYTDGVLELSVSDKFHADRFAKVEEATLAVVRERFPDVKQISIVETAGSASKDAPYNGRAGESVVRGAIEDEPIIGKLIKDLNLEWIE